jgi:pimeloyl-ACP methyl ester carboxylesterase
MRPRTAASPSNVRPNAHESLEASMLRYSTRALPAIIVALTSLAAIAQSNSPAQPKHIRANGVDLSYVEQGTGAPVVFVHGAVGDLRFWEPQRTAFAKQHRFIAYTYRYHGTEAWPDDGKLYSGETHAADLAAFISALKAGPVHLVGLSYGGLLAAMVAMKDPSLIRTLTLAEPGMFSLLDASPDGKTALEEWQKGTAPMIAAIKSGDNQGAIRQLSALVTGVPDSFDKLPAALQQILRDNARTLPVLFQSTPVNVTCEMLQAIKLPTLVVRGDRTPRFFSAINDEVGRCIAGSQLVVIPKASHTMSYDNPDGFNRAIFTFVAKAPAVKRSQPR